MTTKFPLLLKTRYRRQEQGVPNIQGGISLPKKKGTTRDAQEARPQCYSLDRTSSHFHLNGDFFRFTDWKFIHQAHLSVIGLNAYLQMPFLMKCFVGIAPSSHPLMKLNIKKCWRMCSITATISKNENYWPSRNGCATDQEGWTG